MGFGAALSGIGSLVSAGSSLFGGSSASKAAKNNAKVQAAIASAQLQQQARATQQARADLSPYANTGVDANQNLAALLGIETSPVAPTRDQFVSHSFQITKKGRMIPTSSFDEEGYNAALSAYQRAQDIFGRVAGAGESGYLSRNFSPEDYAADPGFTPMVKNLEELQATPGYQFQLEQGQQSVNNSAAARGNLLSGATLKELTRFGQGLASTSFQDAWNRSQQAYQNAFNRDTTNKNNRFQRLSTVSGSGQNAAANQGGYTTQGAQASNSILGGYGSALASNYNTLGGIGMGLAGNLNQAIQGGLSNYALLNYLGNRNDSGGNPRGFTSASQIPSADRLTDFGKFDVRNRGY